METEISRTVEERAESIQYLNSMINTAKAAGKIRLAPKPHSWKCIMPSCDKAGAHTNSVSGTEGWYCFEHLR